ncbi:MAG: hypothetical protein F6K22_07915 [Okeania sp. SIO2F4]|uniref:hypothetical protein n=1 Tax=Okeania sp. SIO2F4 TaxID=2607790 RepID=UPI00142A56AE|nr:hypothetical protein [Okeania sp. SIO2F4]NES02777.1 hypothetical protein [Okeania sp. SIO2F4]
MSDVQQRERIAKALSNRNIQPTDEAIDKIIEKGGTTAAINEFIKEQQPEKDVAQQQRNDNQLLDVEAGSQMIQGMVEEIAEANSDELADAIQALTLMKAIGKVQTGYTGDLTKSAIDSLKKGFGGIFSKVSTSVGKQNQYVESGKLPSLLQTETPKLLNGKSN